MHLAYLTEGRMSPTPESIEAARRFFTERWLAHRNTTDLTGACVFASVFVQQVFGGHLRGNWHHHWVDHPEAGVLDLTDAVGVDMDQPHSTHRGCPREVYQHDRVWWGFPEARETRDSVVPRMKSWAREFVEGYI